ncbi:hypothetical protein PARU111607_14970 [Palleronia rufa]
MCPQASPPTTDAPIQPTTGVQLSAAPPISDSPLIVWNPATPGWQRVECAEGETDGDGLDRGECDLAEYQRRGS